MQQTRKGYGGKKRCRQRNSQGDCKELIRDRHLPRHGLGELQQAVRRGIQRFDERVKSGEEPSRALFRECIGLLISAMYVLAAQGRIAALAAMKLKDSAQLLKDGFAMSTVFKTASTFGLQPVMLPKEAANVLMSYLSFLRPAAAGNEAVEPDEQLFLKWDGCTMSKKELGQALTGWFRQELEIQISPTTCRKLTETNAAAMLDQGIITPAQRRSISNVSGHGPEVAQQYYVLRDRTVDARNAAAVFDNSPSQCVQPSPPLRTIDFLTDSPAPEEERARGESERGKIRAARVATSSADSEFKEIEVSLDNDYADWGTEHPSYGSTKLKIPWSKGELNHLGKLVKDTLASDPDIKGRIYSFCLKKLRKDPAALPIFHKNHVLNSDRLKTGYLRYEMLRGEQQEMNY